MLAAVVDDQADAGPAHRRVEQRDVLPAAFFVDAKVGRPSPETGRPSVGDRGR